MHWDDSGDSWDGAAGQPKEEGASSTASTSFLRQEQQAPTYFCPVQLAQRAAVLLTSAGYPNAHAFTAALVQIDAPSVCDIDLDQPEQAVKDLLHLGTHHQGSIHASQSLGPCDPFWKQDVWSGYNQQKSQSTASVSEHSRQTSWKAGPQPKTKDSKFLAMLPLPSSAERNGLSSSRKWLLLKVPDMSSPSLILPKSLVRLLASLLRPLKCSKPP